MPLAGQRCHRDRRHIPATHHRDTPVACRGVDRAIAHHAEQVLHEDQSDDRRGEARSLECLYCLPVLTRDLERRMLVGAEHRHLDDLVHASAGGGPDDVELTLP
jgi:hypothetical protein